MDLQKYCNNISFIDILIYFIILYLHHLLYIIKIYIYNSYLRYLIAIAKQLFYFIYSSNYTIYKFKVFFLL